MEVILGPILEWWITRGERKGLDWFHLPIKWTLTFSRFSRFGDFARLRSGFSRDCLDFPSAQKLSITHQTFCHSLAHHWRIPPDSFIVFSRFLSHQNVLSKFSSSLEWSAFIWNRLAEVSYLKRKLKSGDWLFQFYTINKCKIARIRSKWGQQTKISYQTKEIKVGVWKLGSWLVFAQPFEVLAQAFLRLLLCKWLTNFCCTKSL